jgi:hypothetical protein
MSLAEIHSLLTGDVGSTVTVAVVRPRRAEPQKIVITRDGHDSSGERQDAGR